MVASTENIEIFLGEMQNLLELWEDSCHLLLDGFNPGAVDQLFRAAHSVKGSGLSVEMVQLAEFVHQVEELLVMLKGSPEIYSQQLIQRFLDAHQYLNDWCKSLVEDHRYVPEECAQELGVYLTLCQSYEKLTKNIAKSSSATGAGQSSAMPSAAEDEKTVEKKKSGKSSERNLRINVSKIEQLSRNLGELTNSCEILKAFARQTKLEPLVAAAIDELVRLQTVMNLDIIKLRLVPVETTLKRLKASIVNLAERQRKDVQVVLVGGHVEIDKVVLDKLGDALNHMVVNAVDHGIETSREREEAGKSAQSMIIITARSYGKKVVLTVRDDGRGLDKSSLVKKAMDRGLVQNGAELSDSEAFRLILLPGFSTVQQVSSVSGRGVGMDVVDEAIRGLGGQLVIKSELGQGTTFEIHLPTSINIKDALIVREADQNIAIALEDVQRVLLLRDFPQERLQNGQRVLYLEEQIYEVQHIKRFIDIGAGTVASSIDSEGVIGLLVQERGRAGIVAVDSIALSQRIFLQDCTGVIRNHMDLMGTAILNDGSPAMVVDIRNWLHSGRFHYRSVDPASEVAGL